MLHPQQPVFPTPPFLSSIVLPPTSPRLFSYAQLARFVPYNFELAAPNPNPRIHNVDSHHRAVASGDYPGRTPTVVPDRFSDLRLRRSFRQEGRRPLRPPQVAAAPHGVHRDVSMCTPFPHCRHFVLHTAFHSLTSVLLLWVAFDSTRAPGLGHYRSKIRKSAEVHVWNNTIYHGEDLKPVPNVLLNTQMVITHTGLVCFLCPNLACLHYIHYMKRRADQRS
jgi:hypothetical protein